MLLDVEASLSMMRLQFKNPFDQEVVFAPDRETHLNLRGVVGNEFSPIGIRTAFVLLGSRQRGRRGVRGVISCSHHSIVGLGVLRDPDSNIDCLSGQTPINLSVESRS